MNDLPVTPDAGAEPIASPEPIVEDRSDIPDQVAPRSISDIVSDVLKDMPEEWDGEAPPVPEPKERDEAGKFKGKDKPEEPEERPEEAPKEEPAPQVAAPVPERFSPAAKEAWAKAPPEVQHEVARMQRELEAGLNEYRQRDEPLKQYRQLAEQNGVKFEDAVANYVKAEQALTENPVQALAQMADAYVPGGFKAFLAKVTGQQQDTPPQDAVLSEIRAENARLRADMQRFTQGLAQQQQAQTDAQARAQLEVTVQRIAGELPRFEELRGEMRRLIETGYVSGDDPETIFRQAYDTAARLIPAPVAPAPQPEPVQTRAQALSVTGAPDSGSNPRHRKPAANPHEAVSRAFAQLGLN